MVVKEEVKRRLHRASYSVLQQALERARVTNKEHAVRWIEEELAKREKYHKEALKNWHSPWIDPRELTKAEREARARTITQLRRLGSNRVIRSVNFYNK